MNFLLAVQRSLGGGGCCFQGGGSGVYLHRPGLKFGATTGTIPLFSTRPTPILTFNDNDDDQSHMAPGTNISPPLVVVRLPDILHSPGRISGVN